MKPRTVYLMLSVIGILLPCYPFLPWLRQHGPDLPLFFQELQVNPVSTFFAADVVVSAVVVLVFSGFEHRRLGRSWWLPIPGVLIFGVAFALPFLLYLRDPGRSRCA